MKRMKTAIVMGASGGMGQSIVRVLAQKGYSVVCHYFQGEKKLLNLVEEMRSQYPQQDFFMVSLNMLQENEIEHFVSDRKSVV
jgi:3-oxoacyl-[acyl-carrier protein] reductase